MNHPSWLRWPTALSLHSIATVRYNFPYMENKKSRPDPPAIAGKTVGMVISKPVSSFPTFPCLPGKIIWRAHDLAAAGKGGPFVRQGYCFLWISITSLG